MSAASRRREASPFPAAAHELRQIARTMKAFGLPSVTTDRAVERIRAIADQLDGRTEIMPPGPKGEGG